MQTCIAIDWLQLQVLVPNKFETVTTKYKIVREGYQTRHYKSVYTISDKRTGEEIAVLAAEPHSGILKQDGGLLKISNKYLYQVNLRAFIEGFLREIKCAFVSITRLDIAVDLLRFDTGMPPGDFVAAVVSNKFIKTKQTDFKTAGRMANVIKFDYIKFGSETSAVSYYLYNKSREMQDVKLKPWIVDNWRANGYDTTDDVWRLEFSLKNNQKGFFDPETGLQIAGFKDLNMLDWPVLVRVWQFHFDKYFSFVVADKKGRNMKQKKRLKPVRLMDNVAAAPVAVKLSEKQDSGRSDKIFFKKLMKLNQELRGQDYELGVFTNELAEYLCHNRMLSSWVSKKFPQFVYSMRDDFQQSFYAFKQSRFPVVGKDKNQYVIRFN